jgi:hypothetical protein
MRIFVMSPKWKERAEKIALAVIPSVLLLVITAFLKGEELKGLGKIAVLLRVLNAGIPLWLFLFVLVIALFGSVHWYKFRRKQLIHVEWKNDACLWCIATAGTEKWMQVNLHGFITNCDKENALIITSVYLEGTKPALSLRETVTLPPEHVCDEYIYAVVKPVLVEEGGVFEGNVIFVDQFQRKHKVRIDLKGHAPQPQQAQPAKT